MNNHFSVKLSGSAAICLIFIALLFSCAVMPAIIESPAMQVPESPVVQIPVKPEKPEVPELIMGNGLVSANNLSSFLLGINPGADASFVEGLAFIYIEEAELEGVNHDIAFAQMCLETGYLRFGNLVSPEQNNFAGLGAIGPGQPGLFFPTPRIGVRAQIQHLKAYACDEPLNQELVNPRFRFVRRGSAPSISGLAGTWAADRSYAEKINAILNSLYNFSFEN